MSQASINAWVLFVEPFPTTDALVQPNAWPVVRLRRYVVYSPSAKLAASLLSVWRSIKVLSGYRTKILNNWPLVWLYQGLSGCVWLNEENYGSLLRHETQHRRVLTLILNPISLNIKPPIFWTSNFLTTSSADAPELKMFEKNIHFPRGFGFQSSWLRPINDIKWKRDLGNVGKGHLYSQFLSFLSNLP